MIHVGKADCVGLSCRDLYPETCCAPYIAADASILHRSSPDRAPLAGLVPYHQTESPWSLTTRQSAPGRPGCLSPDGAPWAARPPSLNEPEVGALFWALHRLPSVPPLLGQLIEHTVSIPVLFIPPRHPCSHKRQGEARVRFVVVSLVSLRPSKH